MQNTEKLLLDVILLRNTYSMNTYVLLHLEQIMTSQSLSNYCVELRAVFYYYFVNFTGQNVCAGLKSSGGGGGGGGRGGVRCLLLAESQNET